MKVLLRTVFMLLCFKSSLGRSIRDIDERFQQLYDSISPTPEFEDEETGQRSGGSPRKPECHTDDEPIAMTRAFTRTNIKLWENGEVQWSFVSNGDEFKEFAFYTDPKIGFSEREVRLLMTAMKQIENETCIKFKRVTPTKGQDWLMVMRETTTGTGVCQRNYIAQNLVGKDINGLGDVFEAFRWSSKCWGGGYVLGLGADEHTELVVAMPLHNHQSHIGLLVHEIGHALGLDHTQKRADRDDYIEVLWENIEDGRDNYQYQKCQRFCENHGVEYDCMSIMHYEDYQGQIGNRPTMKPKNATTCDVSSDKIRLTATDIEMLEKMYPCSGSPSTTSEPTSESGSIESPNYPNDYNNYDDEEYPLVVASGSRIELEFEDFVLEPSSRCQYDYLTILDTDGSSMMTKCGTDKPPKTKSSGNKMTVKFHSDRSIMAKGFKANWRAV